MSKNGRCSGTYTHTERLRGRLVTPLLRRIANQLPPTERKVAIEKCPRQTSAMRISDETVVTILVRHLRGESIVALGKEFGVSKGVIGQWKSGVARAHLLDQAERITRKVA